MDLSLLTRRRELQERIDTLLKKIEDLQSLVSALKHANEERGRFIEQLKHDAYALRAAQAMTEERAFPREWLAGVLMNSRMTRH